MNQHFSDTRKVMPDAMPLRPDGIKLEDQVLITETGVENLTRYPFDSVLLG